METLNLHDRSGSCSAGQTQYFHRAWSGLIQEWLGEKEWDAIDVTGVCFTPGVLADLFIYCKNRAATGHPIQIIDNSSRIYVKRYLGGAVGELEHQELLDNTYHIEIPSTVQDYKNVMTFVGSHTNEPVCVRNNGHPASAALFTIIALRYPNLQLLYNFPRDTLKRYFMHRGVLTKECMEALKRRDSLNVLLLDGVGTMVNVPKCGDGRYDFGAMGRYTFEEVRADFAIMPDGFGERQVTPPPAEVMNDRRAINELDGLTQILVMALQDMSDHIVKTRDRDLRSVLDRGYV